VSALTSLVITECVDVNRFLAIPEEDPLLSSIMLIPSRSNAYCMMTGVLRLTPSLESLWNDWNCYTVKFLSEPVVLLTRPYKLSTKILDWKASILELQSREQVYVGAHLPLTLEIMYVASMFPHFPCTDVIHIFSMLKRDHTENVMVMCFI
jgi:hypothetical protein